MHALLDDGVPAERIVVVDNGSKDDSVDRLRAEFRDVVLVSLPENVGYARAANRGAAALPGDAYLVMNNDAFVHAPGSVRRLWEALSDPGVGMVAPLLLNDDLTLQPTVRPLPTPGVSLLRAIGLGRAVPNALQPSWSHHWDHGDSRDVQAVDGAVFLVRGTTWDELGGYDETRRMYAEDSDLCWRTRRLGWRIRFERSAQFVHLGNATGSRRWTNAQRARLIGREEAKLIRDQLSPFRAAVSIGATSAYLTWRQLAYLARGDRAAAGTLGAERAGYLSGLRS